MKFVLVMWQGSFNFFEKFNYLVIFIALMGIIRNINNVHKAYLECELKSQNLVKQLERRTSRKLRMGFGVAEFSQGNFLESWFPKPGYNELDAMFIEIWDSSILFPKKLAVMKLDFQRVYENKGVLIVWVWDTTLLAELERMVPLFVHTLSEIFKSQLGISKLDYIIEEKKRTVLSFFQ